MLTEDAFGDAKKRKITLEVSGRLGNEDTESEINPATALTVKSISVSLPLRKKLDLFLTPTQLVAGTAGTTEFALNYRHDRIEAAFLLEVPEKTKPQWNLIVAFTRKNATTLEYFQATLMEDTIKNIVQPVSGEQYSGSIKEMVILYFQRRDINIISDETIGPTEMLFQVTAHRGSKDGLLYFLPGYILFGFKKPLVLFKLDSILSISYSSITRSTFNIIIKYVDSITHEEGEIEFSIIDQMHYDSINRFVTEKQLHNDSMAEKRRAKIDTKAQFPTELGKAAQAEQQGTLMGSAAAEEARGSGGQGLSILDNDFDGSDEDEDEDFNSDTKEDDSDSENDSDNDEDDDAGDEEE